MMRRSFSTLYGSSGFFNRPRAQKYRCAAAGFSTLYGSSGFFNAVQRQHTHAGGSGVSVPSTGQVDSSTMPLSMSRRSMFPFQYPLRVKWILQPGGDAPRGIASHEFQYPLRVKWILQRSSAAAHSCWRQRSFSTLYGSSGFFNHAAVDVAPFDVSVSVPSTGQVDSSTRR